MAAIITDKLLNLKQVADVLGKSQATLKSYVRKGLPVARKDGVMLKFEINDVRGWIDRNIGKPDNDEHENITDPENALKQKVKHESRLKAAQADLAELKYQEALGKLISADDAIELFRQEVLLLVNKLNQLPKKAAALVYLETTQKKCESILEREKNEALSALVSHKKTAAQLSRELVKAKDYKEINSDD